MRPIPIAFLLLAGVAAGGDEPRFQGLGVADWAAQLEQHSTRDEAGAALAAGGPEAIAVLNALLRAHRALTYLPYVLEVVPDPRPLVPALILLLADGSTEVRRSAAHALCRTGRAGAAAVPALVCAMADPDESVANRASAALGYIGRAAVPALTAALSDPRIRGRAADALGSVGRPAASAAAALLTLLGDGTATWSERGNAADALGEIGVPWAVPTLTRGLADPDEWVRRNCAEALGKSGTAALPAVPAILDALADDDESVRREATDALWRLGEPAIRTLIERFEASVDRTVLGTALAAAKRDAIPYLVPLLAKPDTPWRADAERALALVGWEALAVLRADHPSAPRVAELVLTEGVARVVRAPERYRTVPAAPPKRDALPAEATWETGSGHGFTLALHRGRWTPQGFSVRVMSYVSQRPRRVGEREVETVAVRTTTIPRPRAEAMLRMVLATSRVTFEKEKREWDGTFWSSSRDFHAAVALRTGVATTYDEGYTGYSGSFDDLKYARVVACTELLGEGIETCEWTEAAANDEDRAILAARFASIARDSWWVRERLLLMAKAIGDARCLPPLEAFIATEPDETPRDHRYAMDAYAGISGIDLRPTPFRDRDVAATRERYLAHFAKRER